MPQASKLRQKLVANALRNPNKTAQFKISCVCPTCGRGHTSRIQITANDPGTTKQTTRKAAMHHNVNATTLKPNPKTCNNQHEHDIPKNPNNIRQRPRIANNNITRRPHTHAEHIRLTHVHTNIVFYTHAHVSKDACKLCKCVQMYLFPARSSYTHVYAQHMCIFCLAVCILCSYMHI